MKQKLYLCKLNKKLNVSFKWRETLESILAASSTEDKAFWSLTDMMDPSLKDPFCHPDSQLERLATAGRSTPRGRRPASVTRQTAVTFLVVWSISHLTRQQQQRRLGAGCRPLSGETRRDRLKHFLFSELFGELEVGHSHPTEPWVWDRILWPLYWKN